MSRKKNKKIRSFLLEECCICFEYMDNINKRIILKCNHKFHLKCLKDWSTQNNNTITNHNNDTVINGLCPICNSPYLILIKKEVYNKKNCCLIL